MRFLSSPVFFFSASFVTAKIVTPEVDSFINNLLSEWHTPSGISLAVVSKAQDGSWEIETKGYGASDLKGTPVDESTLFYIGSNSKVIFCELDASINNTNRFSALQHYRDWPRDF